ncbi:MAG: hypothetical protein R3Y43_03375 [Alphaproteobacteria bacterium]
MKRQDNLSSLRRSAFANKLETFKKFVKENKVTTEGLFKILNECDIYQKNDILFCVLKYGNEKLFCEGVTQTSNLIIDEELVTCALQLVIDDKKSSAVAACLPKIECQNTTLFLTILRNKKISTKETLIMMKEGRIRIGISNDNLTRFAVASIKKEISPRIIKRLLDTGHNLPLGLILMLYKACCRGLLPRKLLNSILRSTWNTHPCDVDIWEELLIAYEKGIVSWYQLYLFLTRISYIINYEIAKYRIAKANKLYNEKVIDIIKEKQKKRKEVDYKRFITRPIY